jgi:hypothetical protein
MIVCTPQPSYGFETHHHYGDPDAPMTSHPFARSLCRYADTAQVR